MQPEDSPGTEPARTHKAWRMVLPGVLLMGLVSAVFFPALNGSFIYYDEHWHILDNDPVKGGFSLENVRWAFTSFYASNWHPLTWLSHMLDCEIYGLHSRGHHLTSILLHAINTVLVWLVLRRLTGAAWPAFAVAVFFGVHPLRAESVAWISERKDVLSTFFWMLALWSYAAYVERSRARSPASKVFYGVTLLLFVCGLMSKASLVTFPCVLLLLDYWPLGRISGFEFRISRSLARIVLEKVPFFLAAAVVSAFTYTAQGHAGMMSNWGNFTLAIRIQNALVSYLRYLGKLFWPVDLCTLYPHPGQWPLWIVALAVTLAGGVSAFAWWHRRARPYLLVGWLWYIITMVPMIGIVQVGPQSMADRYTYVPTIGILIMLAWGVRDLWGRHPRLALGLSTAGGLAALVCLPLTWRQAGYWKNGETIWRHTLSVTTNNYAANHNLAVILLEQERREEAIPLFREALRLNPDYVEGQFFLGSTLIEAERIEEGIPHLQEVLRQWPDFINARHNLGNALLEIGRVDEAIAEFRELARRHPKRVTAHLQLARALKKGQARGEAIAAYRTALSLDADSEEALNNLAWLLATDPDSRYRNGIEAVYLAERGCTLTEYKQAVFVGTLAAAYAEAGRFEDAVRTAQTAEQMWRAEDNEPLAAFNHTLLELYQKRQPYREPLAVSEKKP